jgi:hypothetical protein
MRRLAHRLSKALTVFFALACVAAAAFYFCARAGVVATLETDRDVAALEIYHRITPSDNLGKSSTLISRHVAGGEVEYERWRGGNWSVDLIIPHWFLLLLTAFGLACSVATLLLTRARRGKGNHPLCGACGYDLSGNLSGVCPECGTGVRIGQQITCSRR